MTQPNSDSPDTSRMKVSDRVDLSAETVDQPAAPGRSFAETKQLGSAPDGEPAPVAAPDVPGRYVNLQAHARGGLGEVFRGRDVELNRPVAVKRIQERHHHDTMARDRFLREAEVTACLEHPGVVPVYGLVRGSDGQPCYAMRFIQGASMHEAIAAFYAATDQDESERKKGFRQLLGRFISLCNTVAYAHSRGIIHRDLKPHNVMLGSYGETLLVDWGLARGVELPPDATPEQRLIPSVESVSSTLHGEVIGTPAYMSPEQAAGDQDKIGPGSDVYSLGATLYHLLTSQPALSGSWSDMQVSILRGKFPRPASVKPGIPPALEAICLRAMALEPADRYADALALAADVERWLADEPVSAYPEPWWDRTRRWMRRHRTFVTGAVASVVVAAIFLAVLAILIGRQKDELADSNDRLETLNAELELANSNETAQRKRAEVNERSASEQRNLALSTIRRVVDDIHGDLKDRPGLDGLRKKLLKTAIEGLSQVARSADTTSAIDYQTFLAHLEMGQLFYDYGGLGDAEQQFRRAEQVSRQGLQLEPDSVSFRRALAGSILKLGDVDLRQGNATDAVHRYKQSLDIARALADAQPNKAEARRDLAMACEKLGDVTMKQGHPTEALRHYEAMLDAYKSLAGGDSPSPQALRDLAVGYSRLGDVSLRLSKAGDVFRYYGEALAVRKRLLKANPTSVIAQRDLAISHGKLGNVGLELGKIDDAIEHLEDAIKIFKELVGADPQEVALRRDLAETYSELGDAQVRKGRLGDGLQSQQLAVDILTAVAEAHPTDTWAKRDLALAHNHIGLTSLSAKRDTDALKSFTESQRLLKTLVTTDPSNAQFRRDLALTFGNIGDVHLQTQKPADAERYYRDALDSLNALLERDEANAIARRDLVVANSKLGDLCVQLGKSVEGLRYHEAALSNSEALLAKDSANQMFRRDTALCLRNLGDASARLGDSASAVKYYSSALPLLKILVDANPMSAQSVTELTVVNRRLGEVHLKQNDASEALLQYRQIIAARKALSDRSPANSNWQRNVALAHSELGDIYLRLGQETAALQAFEDALAIVLAQAEANAESMQAQSDYIVTLVKLGTTEWELSRPVKARERFEKASAILTMLDEKGKLKGTQIANWPRITASEISRCRLAERALTDLDFALTQPKNLAADLLALRSLALARDGKAKEAAATADELARLEPKAGNNLYRAARAFALAAAIKDNAEKREEFSARAMALLVQAREAGHFSKADRVLYLKNELALAGLRTRQDFQKFIKELD